MKKRIMKHGNSRMLIIPRKVLDLLGWSEDQLLELVTDGENLYLRPTRDTIDLFSDSDEIRHI